MIINHTYRFIYIKTKKTAGTSLEIALSQYCGPGDILTPIGKRDEPIRSELGYQGPANFLIPRERYTWKDRIDRYLLRREVAYWNHIPAAEIRERIGVETWNSYFKFCVERNPWDRAISAYHWENRSRKSLPDFGRFLAQLERKDYLSNWSTYTIDGRIAVDRILRYEDLASEVESLARQLGLPGPLTLPNAKRQYRKDRRPYREAYTDEQREFVARACAREIREFGYVF